MRKPWEQNFFRKFNFFQSIENSENLCLHEYWKRFLNRCFDMFVDSVDFCKKRKIRLEIEVYEEVSFKLIFQGNEFQFPLSISFHSHILAYLPSFLIFYHIETFQNWDSSAFLEFFRHKKQTKLNLTLQKSQNYYSIQKILRKTTRNSHPVPKKIPHEKIILLHYLITTFFHKSQRSRKKGTQFPKVNKLPAKHLFKIQSPTTWNKK